MSLGPRVGFAPHSWPNALAPPCGGSPHRCQKLTIAWNASGRAAPLPPRRAPSLLMPLHDERLDLVDVPLGVVLSTLRLARPSLPAHPLS